MAPASPRIPPRSTPRVTQGAPLQLQDRAQMLQDGSETSMMPVMSPRACQDETQSHYIPQSLGSMLLEPGGTPGPASNKHTRASVRRTVDPAPVLKENYRQFFGDS